MRVVLKREVNISLFILERRRDIGGSDMFFLLFVGDYFLGISLDEVSSLGREFMIVIVFILLLDIFYFFFLRGGSNYDDILYYRLDD